MLNRKAIFFFPFFGTHQIWKSFFFPVFFLKKMLTQCFESTFFSKYCRIWENVCVFHMCKTDSKPYNKPKNFPTFLFQFFSERSKELYKDS